MIPTNKRIGYIDALRGFAIFMIVFMHVEHFSLGITYDKSVWGSLGITFFLPVFFFISGFLAKKEIPMSLLKDIWKKTIFLIVPAVLFYVFYYCLCRGESILLLFSKGPRCYWFTFALFYIFVLYYLIQYFGKTLSKPVRVIVLLSVSLFCLCIYVGGTKFYELDFLPVLCISNVCRYLWYFSIGHICSCYSRQFEGFISNDKVKGIAILLFVIVFVLTWKKVLIQNSLVHVLLLDYLLWDLGTFVVIVFFHHHRLLFESDTLFSRLSSFIGKRTLDIYLIHWFFIPDLTNWYQIASGKVDIANSIIELAIVIAISVYIIVLCLLVSSIIRSSSSLGHYLLGTKLRER